MAMRSFTLRRSVITAAILGVALACRASPHAVAADAADRDVQVNLDVLDSLAPAAGASATGAGAIHLHAPHPKITATHAVATAPQTPARVPAPAVAAVASQREGASAPATENAAASAPVSAGSNAPPAAAAAAPVAATAAPPPPLAPAPVTAMNAPPLAVKPPATSVAPAATPPAAPKAPPPPPTRVLFATGAADVPDVAKPRLDALAAWLGTNQQARIEVMAYAAGDAEQANDARRVSLSRAIAVRSYLAQHGVATTRMEVRALGNHSAEGEPPDRVDIATMDR